MSFKLIIYDKLYRNDGGRFHVFEFEALLGSLCSCYRANPTHDWLNYVCHTNQKCCNRTFTNTRNLSHLHLMLANDMGNRQSQYFKEDLK